MARCGPKPRADGDGGDDQWVGFRLPADEPAAVVAEYDRLRAALEAKSLLSRTDPRLVLLTARVHGMLDRAFEGIRKLDSLTYVLPNGAKVADPLVAMTSALSQRLRGLLSDLGLSPKTSRLAKRGDADAPEGQDNAWGDLLDVAG